MLGRRQPDIERPLGRRQPNQQTPPLPFTKPSFSSTSPLLGPWEPHPQFHSNLYRLKIDRGADLAAHAVHEHNHVPSGVQSLSNRGDGTDVAPVDDVFPRNRAMMTWTLKQHHLPCSLTRCEGQIHKTCRHNPDTP